MRGLLGRPLGRVIIGLGALLVIAIIAAAVYIFAPSAGVSGSSGAQSTGGASTAAATLAPTANGKVFTIDTSASQASFTMHETLFGQPRQVVGTTRIVSGQILVVQSAPSQSKVGQIRVDLTGLKTDSDLRNQTIQNRILETGVAGDQYAVFTMQSIAGLPGSIVIGQKVAFTMTGNLTIHGVTRVVTFTAATALTSATTLVGQAQTTVRYSDFGVSIPNVPSVTGVSDTTTLTLTFTARA